MLNSRSNRQHTCSKCANISAIRRHPCNGGKVEISGANSWDWTANVERGTEVEVDHVVRANGHVMIAMIAWHPKIWQDHCRFREVLQQGTWFERKALVITASSTLHTTGCHSRAISNWKGSSAYGACAYAYPSRQGQLIYIVKPIDCRCCGNP